LNVYFNINQNIILIFFSNHILFLFEGNFVIFLFMYLSFLSLSHNFHSKQTTKQSSHFSFTFYSLSILYHSFLSLSFLILSFVQRLLKLAIICHLSLVQLLYSPLIDLISLQYHPLKIDIVIKVGVRIIKLHFHSVLTRDLHLTDTNT